MSPIGGVDIFKASTESAARGTERRHSAAATARHLARSIPARADYV